MKQAHIYAYGDFVNWQDINASNAGAISLKGVTEAVNAVPDADEIILHIHSRGGEVDEGFAIYDYLVSTGKRVIAKIEGLCASIATVPLMAAKPDDRFIGKHSDFLIHNPWSLGVGDADDMLYISEELRKSEDKLSNFYAEHTTMPIEEIKSLMKEDKRISSEDAIKYGFVSKVLEPVKAYAKINTQKNMNTEQKSFFDKMNEKVDKILALFVEKTEVKAEEKVEIKAMEKKSNDGKTISIDTETDPKVGDAVLVDGNPAPNSSITLEDGSVMTLDADSKISEISTPAEEETESEEMAKLRTENEELKAKLNETEAKFKALEVSAKETDENISKINEKFEILAKSIKSNHSPETEKQSFRTEGKSGNERAEAIRNLAKRK